MSRAIPRSAMLIIMAFLIAFIVELRTVAGFVGIELSLNQYLLVSAILVAIVVGTIWVWNIRAAAIENGTGATREA